jgi:hypothetical protein
LSERVRVPAAQAQTVYYSDLWGKDGEHWSPSSRLPDFSFAGYQAGNQEIPLVPVTTNVKDFGATGDGVTDDTQAFKQAIAATENGALFVPAGRYKITDILKIAKPNFVLRGAGEGNTVLFFARPLGAILEQVPYGDRALLTVRGEQQGEQLATVVGAAERGEYTLQLSSTAGIKPGQMIRLRMKNPPDNSLGCYLYADQGCLNAQRQKWSDGEIVDWAVEVQEVRGNTVTLVRPLRLDVRPEWEPSVWQHRPSVQEVGIEQLTIEFPNAQYEGHGTWAGYYAIVLSQVFNAWIRQVTIVDADRGIEIVRGGYNTISHVTLATKWRQAAANPTGDGTTGHYGFHLHSLTQDNLVTESEIQTTFDHNMAVATFANGNVYSGILSQSGRLDHHGAAPYENLYTELVLTEDAGDLLKSGGNKEDEPNAGARSTLWNIVWLRGTPPERRRFHDFPQLNIIGIDQWTTKKTTDQEWIERWPGGLTSPSNLYYAQLLHRKGEADTTSTPLSVEVAALSSGSFGFENGFTGWNSDTNGSGGGTYSKRIVDKPVLNGIRAAEFKLKVNDPYFAILRNEVAKRDVAEIGGRYVYEFGQYVPSDFATSPLFIETAQFLPDGQHRSAYQGWGPPLCVGIRNGRWELKFARNVDGKKVTEKLDLGPVTRNSWTRFKVEVKWSPKSDGYVRVYKNGGKVLDRSGATTFSSTEVPYFKCGLYTRRAWTLGSKPAPLHSFRIIQDGFSVKKVG